MAYFVGWTVIEKSRKTTINKNGKKQLFKLPALYHDIYQLKSRKELALRLYRRKLKEDDIIAVMWGEVKELTIIK